MTSLDPHPPALVRFVAEGLLASLDAYLAGTLPLHRLARELRVRIDTLAELGPPARALTRLRWLHRDIERLHAALRGAERAEPTADQRAHLTDTIDTVRAVLVALRPPTPRPVAMAAAGGAAATEPVAAAGGARPAAARPVVGG